MPSLLIIDDDRSIRHLIHKSFEDTRIDVTEATCGDTAMERLRECAPDAVLLDLVLPGVSGLEVFHQIRAVDSRLPVIFITADTDSDTAIEAMMLGGYDYLVKPLHTDQLRQVVFRAMETRRMMQVPVEIPIDLEAMTGDHLVGRSPRMLEVYKAIGRAARQNVTVLVTGESGTGKELVARAIYQHSDRREGPFLAVNCAALPDALLESELFGHEKGAFTGADSRRIGKFEQCSGGTIFLDEIGDMAPLVQAKVLRLLQQQEFERVGGNETIRTDVRIIAATNRDLEQMVEDDSFREDLFYRLNGLMIELPALRERPEDLLPLLEHFLTRLSHDFNGWNVEGVSPEAVELLRQYHWPGNIRELQSVLRQAIMNASGPVIVPDFLPEDVRNCRRTGTAPPAASDSQPVDGMPHSNLAQFVDQAIARGTDDLYAESLEFMERYLMTRVLRETNGNQSRAAEILGITRGKVANRIQSFGISLENQITLEDRTG